MVKVVASKEMSPSTCAAWQWRAEADDSRRRRQLPSGCAPLPSSVIM